MGVVKVKNTTAIIFFLFHTFCILVWGLPKLSSFHQELKNSIQPYMLWSGLWQGWDMFSPDPLRLNASIEATVTFEDGSQSLWVFPKMQELGYGERYVKERYRKWRERVRLDDYKRIWPDTSRFVAKRVLASLPEDQRAQKRILKCEFKRFWSFIPPPVEGMIQVRPESYVLDKNYLFHTETFNPPLAYQE